MSETALVEGYTLAISGGLFRTASPRDEPYECVDQPADLVVGLKALRPSIDLLTFTQEPADPQPRFPYYWEWERLAALPLTTYERWYKEIDNKTRNMIRKAPKKRVAIKQVALDSVLVTSIMAIYNESPLIQGRRNWHYGKDLESMTRMLSTFHDRSTFIGAYLDEELIGFVKLVDLRKGSSVMHIIAKAAHRDKAPTNSLLARAIEISASRGRSHLYYALWSRRGLGMFKASHGFVPYEVPRYYVPLTWLGRAALASRLHRGVRERLPETWVDAAVNWRNRLNEIRYRTPDHGRTEVQMQGNRS